MKLKRYQTILFLMALITFFMIGQLTAAELKGVVVEKGSRIAVVGAELVLSPSGAKVFTNKQGEFKFQKVADGSYRLTISHAEFSTVSKKISLKNGRNQELVIEMTPAKKDDNYKRKDEKENKDERERRGSGQSNDPKSSSVGDKTNEYDAEKGQSISMPMLLDMVPNTVVDSYSDAGEIKTMGLTRQVPESNGRREPEYSIMPRNYLPEPSGMFFKNYGTNRFVNTRRDPLSTFALDVDDGSFNIIKEYLNRGTMPPSDAVRIEEFINHFDYGYADPERKPFRLFTEMTSSPTDPKLTMLKIGIKGKELPESDRPSLNLTFVIDVSGSMRAGNRLGLVKQSLGMLLDQLDRDDRVGVVAYGSQARVILQPTSAAHKREIMNAVRSLQAGGSTFAEAGLKLGYQMANRQFDRTKLNRVILCSDGVANVGQTSPEAIMADISEFARKGITLSTFGYGMGNYNDVLLEQLATQGDGRYAYVNDREEADRLFVSQFVSNMALLAREAKVQVSFDPRFVKGYRLIGYENRAIADQRFRDNSQDGGEIGPGHEVTALYELRLVNQKGKRRNNPIGEVTLRWTSPDENEVTEISRKISSRSRFAQFDSARPELRLAIVVSDFASVLKRSPYSEKVNYSNLIDQARSIDAEMRTDQTRELVDLIEKAARLDHHYYSDDDYFTERF